MNPIRARLALLTVLWRMTAAAAPIGPCSPYAASDGDIPSELPGCVHRRRPAPGSLADELEFRRARQRGVAVSDPNAEDDLGSDEVPSFRHRKKGQASRPDAR